MAENFDDDLNIIQETPIELEYIDGDLNIIQALDDEPNDVGGLTSAELKERFDRSGNIIKTYINEKLIPAVLAQDATEVARINAETARAAAEASRAAAETARSAAETARGTAESERDTAEMERKDAETARSTAETNRSNAESLRAAAEQLRAEAEPLRLAAELERIGNEAVREQNEALRVGRDEAKNTAEQQRIRNESERVANETARNVWEEYNSSHSYVPGNKVSTGGSSFLCIQACTGVHPNDDGAGDYWMCIALAGTGSGTGDMGKSVYDTDGRNRDIFKYADEKIQPFSNALMLNNCATAMPFPSGGYNGFQFEDGQFFCVGYNTDKAFLTVDGRLWTTKNLPLVAKWRGIVRGRDEDNQPIYVAINSGGTNASTLDHIWYSYDLETWTKARLAHYNSPDYLRYANRKFIAAHAGSMGTAYHYSEDGKVWLHGSFPQEVREANLRGVEVRGNTFIVYCSNVLVGGTKIHWILTSTDLVNWTVHESPVYLIPMGFFVLNNKYIIPNGNTLYISTDLENWTTTSIPDVGNGNWASALGVNGMYVFLRVPSGFVAYTTDFESWGTSFLGDRGYWYAFAHGNGRYVALDYAYDRYQVTADIREWPIQLTNISNKDGTDITLTARAAMGAAANVVRNYLGGGVYGISRPCSITFDAAIKCAVILEDGKPAAWLWADRISTSYTEETGFVNNAAGTFVKKSDDGKTFTWYHTDSAASQLNTSGKTYHVLIIA